MSFSILSLLGLGFVLGLKHALDADHLAAVSTISTERRSLFGSSMVGALWGVGHTLSLLGGWFLMVALKLEISEGVSEVLEFCVGIMLVVLGINALRMLARSKEIHMHAHEHDGYWHAHPHIHAEQQREAAHSHHGFKLGARPLVVGMVHGLAGSAALTLLVLATIPSAFIGFIYVILFGIGSIGGMMIMSTLFALPARLSRNRFAKANLALRALAGTFSLAFGLFTVLQIGFVN